MKAQSSIEMLALTALFVSMLVPLLLFLISSSSQLNEKSTLEGVRNALLNLKERIEYAYAFCPYEETFSLSIPSTVEEITYANGGLVATYKDGQIYEPLAISNAYISVELKGGAFSRPVQVICSGGVQPTIEVRPA